MPTEGKTPAQSRLKLPFIIIIVLAAAALAASLLIPASDNGSVFVDEARNAPSPVSEGIDRDNPVFLRLGLTPLADCDAVLDYYKENALKEVTPWGLGYADYGIGPRAVFAEATESAAADSSAESQASGAGPGYSATNIQVAGVDEADMVKTDGDYIYVLAGQSLKIISVGQAGADEPPAVISEVEIDFYATDMLLSLKLDGGESLSDALIVIGSEGWNKLRLVQINIDDREAPEVTADFVMDGTYAGSRLSDNTVRLVTTSQPLGFEWETPSGSGLRAEDKALAANKEIILNSELSNWVPAYKDNLDADSRTNSLMGCSQLLVPRVFSGLNTLSIVAFNASEKLADDNWQAIGLAADGRDIYATAEHVYVAASERNGDEPAGEPAAGTSADLKTIIHKFGLERSETAGGGRPVYMASGEVAGSLLNQFSMDEYQGDLRVAITIENFSENARENHVKILRPEAGVLQEIGTIAGLGVDERIFAVRFMGPQAYVVTFRQVDPLYSLDLSDPAEPKALGELKIPGFSSYLHPVADNLLLGVGQEADQEGRTEGLQISLFDTSDPTDPRRVSQLLLQDVLELEETDGIDNTWSSSPAERDHRAFLFHDGVSFVPYAVSWSSFSSSNRSWGNEAGILTVEAGDGALSVDNILKAARSKDAGEDARKIYLEPVRTIVIGELVYGVTRDGELIVWQASSGELLYIISD